VEGKLPAHPEFEKDIHDYFLRDFVRLGDPHQVIVQLIPVAVEQLAERLLIASCHQL
jgi:hypothetical protein